MKLVKILVISGFSLGLTGVSWAAEEAAEGPGATIDFALANETRARWSQKLLAAVHQEVLDLAEIRTALRNHADAEVQDAEGKTPLIILANRLEDPTALAAMRLLLTEGGADSDGTGQFLGGVRPLMAAAMAGNVAALQLLLAAGADIGATVPDGLSVLAFASGKLPILAALSQADPHFCRRLVDNDGQNLLLYNISRYVSDLSLQGAIIDESDNVNDQKWEEILGKAATTIQWLITNCANVNDADPEGDTALLTLLNNLVGLFVGLEAPGVVIDPTAAKQKIMLVLPILRSLLRAGADPKLANRKGHNAFYYVDLLGRFVSVALWQRLRLILERQEHLLQPAWRYLPQVKKQLAAMKISGAVAAPVATGAADAELAALEAELAEKEAAGMITDPSASVAARAAAEHLAELEAQLAAAEARVAAGTPETKGA